MTTSDNWEPTANRFVAFFDIMGFKDLVAKTEHNEIVELLKHLSKSRSKLDKANNTTLRAGEAKFGETKSFTFSDSIFFFSKTDSAHDASKIILDCLFLIKESLKKNIPIKGALSHGKITINLKDSIYFGQPIIDAYLLHDDLHLYSVIADHSFIKQVKVAELETFESLFKFYKTPLKSGRAFHHILKPIEESAVEEMIGYLNNQYYTVSGKPRQYIDNTLEFLEAVKDKIE